MTRSTLGLLITLALGILLMPWVTAAQRPAPVPRIAFLHLVPPPAASEPTPIFEAFRHGLRERDWVDGHNMALEEHGADGTLDAFATLVATLVRLPVDVLVVPNATTAMVAQQATTTIPIVVVSGGLLETGLVASLARPGGNITGISSLNPEVTAKALELLKEAIPTVSRVAVLRGVMSFAPELRAMEAAARSLGVTLQPFEVRAPTELDRTVVAMTHAQADALILLGGSFFGPNRAQIADLAARHRLPSVCPSRRFVEAGCLMSYNHNSRDVGQRIAAYVDKILKGAKPADLPVEQPTAFELVLNLKTAQALGLTIPPAVLFQATEVLR
jgi:putative tryptophan/tyrosine transport system substrate-binding protein